MVYALQAGALRPGPADVSRSPAREGSAGQNAGQGVSGGLRPQLIGGPLPGPEVRERSQTRLSVPRQTSYGNWLDMGVRLSTLATASAWCLGDWLIYGETYFPGRYRDAVEQTALEYKTLRNYAWVARRFTPERRHAKLSFGHHAEVARLPKPEQDFWLRKAGLYGWSRNELRKQVRDSIRERALGESPGDGAKRQDSRGVEQLPVGVTGSQLLIIKQAAAKTGLPVGAWAAQVLEKTAQEILAVAVCTTTASLIAN